MSPKQRISLTALAALCVLLSLPGAARAQCPSVVFAPQQTRTDGLNAVMNLHTVDFDTDGVLDLVGLLNDTGGTGVLTTWKGNGDGTFQLPVTLGTTDIDDMVVTDLNNDGHKDLVIMTTPGSLVVRMGNGSGFDAPITTNPFGTSHQLLIAGNFDGTAYPGIIAASGTVIYVYHGVGNGTFTEISHINTGLTVTALAAADFDGDGRTDIAFGSFGNTIRVFFQNADGSYSEPILLQDGPTPLLDFHVSALVAADLDEDGKLDLVASNFESYTANAGVAVFRNLGAQSFASPLLLLPRTPNAIADFFALRVLDIDGDGHLDLVAADANSSLLMTWIGNHDGTFRSPTYSDLGNSNLFSIAPGYFDGDSSLDLAVGAWQQLITAKKTCAAQVYAFSTTPVITPSQTAPLRALVSGITTSTPLPRGTVTFREGLSPLGTADVDATGFASLDIAGLSLGIHTLVADFSGNSEEGTATSQNVSEKVTVVAPTTTLNLPPSSVYGTPYTFTVTIRNTEFSYDVVSNYILDVDGVQSVRWSGSPVTLNLAPGLHTLTASFEGDTGNAPSSSGPQTITTLKPTPSIANSGGALTVRLGEAHSLQFTLTGVVGLPPLPAPTGTVQLKLGSTVLGSSALVNGVATVSATLPRGSHDVTALYTGDGNYNSTSMNVTLSVLPNTSLFIDARGLTNTISIRCVLPAKTHAVALYRKPSGSSTWTLVVGWTPQTEFDTPPLRGVVYDYQLNIVAGGPQWSNIDSAMLFNDDPVVAQTTLVKRLHFDELALAVNVMRTSAGLSPFTFDPSYSSPIIAASHLAALRTALTEARQSLGMFAPAFTDAAVPGVNIKAVHIQELRDQAR